MAARWLPNNEEFFDGLVRLLEASESNINSASYDNSEFLFRRLDAHERTLSTLLSRIEYTYQGIAEAVNVIRDLQTLLNRTSNFRSHFQRRFFLSVEREGNELTPLTTNLQRDQYGGRGRPKHHVSRDQLQALNVDAGFSWSEIARTLGISERTLRRRRHELGMSVEGRVFSNLSDNELDDYVRQILTVTPGAGLRMVQGALKQRRLEVQRDRVLHSLRRVDPVTTSLRNGRHIIRRTYNVPCPNALWHIDGNHKLIEPYRIVIHGGIDGFSRLAVYLNASTNNRATTVFGCFQEAIQQYNLPSRVRCDLGFENLEVGRYMLEQRGLNRGSIITGTSVHNQRIERLWRDVNRIIVSRFLNIFLFLEGEEVLDPHNEVHLFALHIVYIDLINAALREFVGQWNNHPVTTESNLSPQQLWIRGMVLLQNSGYSAVESVVQDISNYGIDVDGPVPEDDSRLVNVPVTSINVDDVQLANIKNVVKLSLENGDENGLHSFLLALDLLSAAVY